VRIRRTIPTQASTGRASRRSEFPPSEERLGLGEGTSLLGLWFITAHCALLALCFAGAFLEAAKTLGADFSVATLLLELAGCASFGASATAAGMGVGEARE
jgi:hypothetical protein